MTTLRRLLIAALLGTCPACGGDAGPKAAPDDGAMSLAALRASRSEGYGVPDTGDVGLTVRLSLGASSWGGLNDEQLLAWAEFWRTMLEADDRPFVGYAQADPSGGRLNLFDRSPKDGYCVAYAQDAEDPANARVRAFLEGLRRDANAPR